jgi:AcrR family transcriptional regulator
MAASGLTRGGFYNHFKNKDELFTEAVASFLNGRGKKWRDDAGVEPMNGGLIAVQAMIDTYLSDQHLGELDGQCPLIALPSDIARATPEAREAFETLLMAMTWLFEHNLTDKHPDKHSTALVLSSLCVGGMVLSRTIDNPDVAREIQTAARKQILSIIKVPD